MINHSYIFKICFLIIFFFSCKSISKHNNKELWLERKGYFRPTVLYKAKDGDKVKIIDIYFNKFKDTLHILNDGLISVGKDTILLVDVWGITKMNRRRSIIGHSVAVLGVGVIVGGLIYVNSLMNSIYLYDKFLGMLITTPIIMLGSSNIIIGETNAGAFPKFAVGSRKFVIKNKSTNNLAR